MCSDHLTAIFIWLLLCQFCSCHVESEEEIKAKWKGKNLKFRQYKTKLLFADILFHVEGIMTTDSVNKITSQKPTSSESDSVTADYPSNNEMDSFSAAPNNAPVDTELSTLANEKSSTVFDDAVTNEDLIKSSTAANVSDPEEMMNVTDERPSPTPTLLPPYRTAVITSILVLVFLICVLFSPCCWAVVAGCRICSCPCVLKRRSQKRFLVRKPWEDDGCSGESLLLRLRWWCCDRHRIKRLHSKAFGASYPFPFIDDSRYTSQLVISTEI